MTRDLLSIFRLRGPARGALLTLLLAGLAGPAVAEPRTLYEKLAFAELVVHVRTIDGTLRLAECQVLEVLRGSHAGDTIFIAFRGDNMERERYRDRIVFEDGAESILLLVSGEGKEDASRAGGPYRLLDGFPGKIDLPREGAPAVVDAVRRLGAIQDLGDIHQIWAAQRSLLDETNPYLVEAGFQQVLKFRLGNAEMVPRLLDYLDSRDDRFRKSSVQVLAQIFRWSQRRDQPLGNEDHVVARLLTVAMDDPVPTVRVAAVQALHAYGRPEVLPPLRRLAARDPSQDVRYEATVSVYRLSRRHAGGGAGD